MNWLGLVTVALGFVGYFLGRSIARKSMSRSSAFLILCAAVVLAIPALIYDLSHDSFLIFCQDDRDHDDDNGNQDAGG